MNILLISTYDLGHQPFGLASPAAWLRDAGYEVRLLDLAVDSFDKEALAIAELVGFYLPMHTATRLAAPLIKRIRTNHPALPICCFGLYAPLNSGFLKSCGVNQIFSGEFEQELASYAKSLSSTGEHSNKENQVVNLVPKLQFLEPDRTGLAGLQHYVTLTEASGVKRRVGYTEASRGCKHTCKHCPVVPVYNGHFRIVQPEIVLADIGNQVDAGAEHISFGDPDFLNGPGHARRIVTEMSTQFPHITYDAIIKIEHLLKHREMLRLLKDTGCLFVTSAVESLDNEVLTYLDKGHTRENFHEAVELTRSNELVLSPTFIPFTPWTTTASYQDMLLTLAQLELIDQVAPIQLAIRLLLPNGSLLLDLDSIKTVTAEYDKDQLVFPWHHPDPEVDILQTRVLEVVNEFTKLGRSRRETFASIWELAFGTPIHDSEAFGGKWELASSPRTAVPYLNEPWYC